MSRDPNDVVKVFAGPLVEVESLQEVLSEAGIESKVVGTELTGSFGTALPDSIELWVHQHDAEKAKKLIEKDVAGQGETQEGKHGPHGGKFPHPTSNPKPGPAPVRKEPYINPNPGG
jgi:hypothetical protein